MEVVRAPRPTSVFEREGLVCALDEELPGGRAHDGGGGLGRLAAMRDTLFDEGTRHVVIEIPLLRERAEVVASVAVDDERRPAVVDTAEQDGRAAGKGEVGSIVAVVTPTRLVGAPLLPSAALGAQTEKSAARKRVNDSHEA